MHLWGQTFQYVGRQRPRALSYRVPTVQLECGTRHNGKSCTFGGPRGVCLRAERGITGNTFVGPAPGLAPFWVGRNWKRSLAPSTHVNVHVGYLCWIKGCCLCVMDSMIDNVWSGGEPEHDSPSEGQPIWWGPVKGGGGRRTWRGVGEEFTSRGSSVGGFKRSDGGHSTGWRRQRRMATKQERELMIRWIGPTGGQQGRFNYCGPLIRNTVFAVGR